MPPADPPTADDSSPESPERAPDLFSELKRRKVYRVGAAYLAVAFAALEGADLIFPVLGLGAGAFNGLVVASLLGFPLAIILAWTFDLTAAGIERTSPVGPAATVAAPDRWGHVKAALVGAGFVAVVWLGVGMWQPLGPVADTGVPTEMPVLAVLPLEDLSAGGDQAYFADGLHEELLHQLAQLRGIRLTSRTSVSHFRGSPATTTVIADSLGARYVLEGSVRTAGDSIRLTVQLIDALTDEHLWSEALGRSLTLEGLFDLQRTLAIRVAGALGGTLAAESEQALGVPSTESLDAYNEFLRGLHQWNRFEIATWRLAMDHFARAVELDPEFGRAHARLAMGYGALNNFGGGTQGELFPLIREHAQAAVRYAPDQATSHMAMMTISWPLEWDWEASRQSMERALELDPGYVDAMWALAEWHGVIAGNTDRGLELIQEAFRLDPFSVALHTVRAWILTNGRRFEEAAREYQQILTLEPMNTAAALNYPANLALAGRQGEALTLLNRVVGTIPSPRPVTLAVHLARAGDRETAREILNEAMALKDSGGSVPASGIAAAYAALGDVEQALVWLERCFAEEGGIYYLRSPDWDALAGHPRFEALWERVGLYGEHPAKRQP